ncbi:unnamed protein product [Danaus chrysippus]|uniref:(African queen) hypothetical protein n=1 Tax=Danaus chrysippus TaxID=151541 RepID=A0A8J2Q9R5_9NEOP|nr:unnamed protein product [Danaus chrysippus]
MWSEERVETNWYELVDVKKDHDSLRRSPQHVKLCRYRTSLECYLITGRHALDCCNESLFVSDGGDGNDDTSRPPGPGTHAARLYG